MITRIARQEAIPLWRRLLDEAITDPKQLLTELDLDPQLLTGMVSGHQSFKIKAPRYFVEQIRKGDANDPLLRQILPLAAETNTSPMDYSHDPVGDLQASPVPGLIHKYRGRVLLITSPACAIHCRYCFRREYPYSDSVTSGDHWQKSINYIQADSSITEVILSGGDPLTLPDTLLSAFANDLACIPHVQTLRIHTRLPIVLPQRIDDHFCAWIGSTRLRPIMVVHCNHPSELSDDVAEAFSRLHKTGIALYNQSVLLHGVNDDSNVLAELSRKLFHHQVQPYYLHSLDKVTGAAHFEVDANRSQKIYTRLRAELPGYLVPRFVHDLPGQTAKTLL